MDNLVGSVWRLTDVRAFDETGRAHASPLGETPMGIFEFGAHRIMGAIGAGRAPSGASERPRSYFSYTGPYRIEGGELIVDPDGASSPALRSRQVRQIRFEGDKRMILIPPLREGNVTVELGWERLK